MTGWKIEPPHASNSAEPQPGLKEMLQSRDAISREKFTREGCEEPGPSRRRQVRPRNSARKSTVLGNGINPALFNIVMPDEAIANMNKRAAMCRRLANATYDRNLAATLLKMAEEIEIDAKRLEAKLASRRSSPSQSD